MENQTRGKETSRLMMSPKRTQKKILPKISQKPIPLHNNSSQHFYKNAIRSETQLQQWAYVVSPDKKQPRNNKYIHYFDQFYTTKSRINLSTEKQENTSSLLLLDNYFKRKHSSKLKSIIKVPAQLKEEGSSSIGFEGINFHHNRQRRTLQGFFKTKRNFSNQQMGLTGVAVEQPAPQKRKFREAVNKNSDNDLFPSVDYYFNDKNIPLAG